MSETRYHVYVFGRILNGVGLCEDCDEVEANRMHRLHRAAPSTAWQPIETAPRDGTEIIAASIYSVRDRPRVWNVYLTCGDAAGWVTTRGGKAAPTHWMPLPEPPA
jgi:hypothetical protein